LRARRRIRLLPGRGSLQAFARCEP
jgi:hypothetical protein